MDIKAASFRWPWGYGLVPLGPHPPPQSPATQFPQDSKSFWPRPQTLKEFAGNLHPSVM